jgi:hypothetical protein
MNLPLRGLGILLLIVLALPGCFAVTRTETDLYTITERDTTMREDMSNAPGERENGTIYPSPRSVDISRQYVQRDSNVNRYYPAFLRFGGIEAASLIAGGGSTDGSGNGLFGLYDLFNLRRTSDSRIFSANMFRFFPYETRLRWFNDAPNWTVGTSPLEMFFRQKDSLSDVDPGEYLYSVLNGYIRHRIFFREEPPYMMLVPFIGVSIFPSVYVNAGATFDVGSYGGFNLRAYAGFVSGTASLTAEPNDQRDYGVTFPYGGIGVSALDFVNKTEELFIEWKDHDHSALEVSVANLDLVYSTSATRSLFALGTSDTAASLNFPTGVIARIASATYPLPFGDGRFFVGTSLFNVVALSSDAVGYGFLPLRAGYRYNLMNDELNLEPFAELTYYPSTVLHIGSRATIKVFDWLQANALLGYVNGSTNIDVITGLRRAADIDLDSADNFSSFYLGIGVGVGDFFHTPEEVARR